MRSVQLTVMAFLVVSVSAWVSDAQAAISKRALTMEDVVRTDGAQLRALSTAPAGVLGAYVEAGKASALSTWDHGHRRTVVEGTIGALSPNGRWLLYLNGKTWRLRDQTSLVERSFDCGGEPSTFTGVPIWSGDSRYVAAHYDLRASNLSTTLDLPEAKGPRVQDVDMAADAVRRRASAQFNPHLLIWRTDQSAPDVTKIAATEGYSGSWRTLGPKVHSYVFAVAQHDYGGQQPFTAIRTHQAETRGETELFRSPIFNQGAHPQVSADGRQAAVLLDLDTPAFGVANNIELIDLASGAARRLTQDLDAGELRWGRDGALYFTRRNGGLQVLSRIKLNGPIEDLTSAHLDRRNLVVSASGDELFYTSEDGSGRKALMRWSIQRQREQEIALIADPGEKFELGRFSPVAWKTSDGVELKGFLITPPAFNARRTYPLLVDVHGGGPGTPLLLFSLFGYLGQTPLEWHAWASLGYVVFVPDYRSSGEYGRAVNLTRYEAIDGDPTGIEQDASDVQSGVEWLLAQGFVDPHRVAIFGQSAGGGRVNALLTQSRLFSAGVIHDPIASGPQAEALRLASQGLPLHWSGPNLSPTRRKLELGGFLFDGWRSTTPTLIMVGNPQLGALDPLSAEVLFSQLLSMHIPTRFLRFPDDGHEPATPQSALLRFEVMKDWLQRYAPSDNPSDANSQLAPLAHPRAAGTPTR